MLNLGTQLVRTCDGLSRRACLQVGTAGLFGLSLPRVEKAIGESPAIRYDPERFCAQE